MILAKIRFFFLHRWRRMFQVDVALNSEREGAYDIEDTTPNDIHTDVKAHPLYFLSLSHIHIDAPLI